jgi:hypothetical protein
LATPVFRDDAPPVFLGKELITAKDFQDHMHRRTYADPQPAMAREKNLVLILLAILVAILLWNSFWLLWRLAVFAFIVFVIYQLLKHYL